MKIGIVGLLADQAEQIRRKCPDHDLHFLPKSKTNGKNIDNFIKSNDKLIIALKFVDHSTSDKFPKTKTFATKGGITVIVDYIKKLPGKVKTLVPAKSSFDEVHDGAPVQPTLVEHKPSIVVLNADAKGRYDYSILKAAHEGDIIRVTRPDNLSHEQWYRRITTTRTYYRRECKIETKAEFSAEWVDITVLKYTVAKRLAKDSLKDAAEQIPTAEVLPVQTFLPPVVTDEKVGLGQVPNFVESTESIDALRERQLAVQLDQEERQLWSNVFHARITLAYGIAESAKFADKAVQEFSKRYRPDQM